MKNWIVLVVLVSITAGCATMDAGKPNTVLDPSAKYLSDFAIDDPALGIAIPHREQYERDGKVVTTVDVVMHTGLYMEAVGGGGVWPVVGTDGDRIFRGLAYLHRINWWGDFILRAILPYERSLLASARFILLSRDAGLAYTLAGNNEPNVPEAAGNEQNVAAGTGSNERIVYDTKEFERDPGHRGKVMERFGASLADLTDLGRIYDAGKPYPFDLGIYEVREFRSGTREWHEFFRSIEERMNQEYVMPDGKKYIGHLTLETFRKLAVANPGFTNGSRFMGALKIPILLPVAIFVPVTAIPMAANTVANVVIATTNDDWEGHFARAKVLRMALAPSFQLMALQYQYLINKRDEQLVNLIRTGRTSLPIRRSN